MYSHIDSAVLAKAKKLKLLILDVDGVLTDGKLFFDGEGNEYKAFHARDGHGIKLLRNAGVEVAVISGRKSASVALRMQSLGVELIYQGYEDKRIAFDNLMAQLGLLPEQAAHVGDDLIDLPVMVRAGLAFAVNDAVAEVKQYADYCTNLSGGTGAVREVCDLILYAQGHSEQILANYLS
ncbi:MAG: 3-deoxy-manno-octulosonate-8-phosphatase KdsC [Methylococcaceae bacterium]|jgi:3-deoxy-D-manno-octulosonate 8-phosphate phosphatase (KDO 8-P phosphatase)